MGFEREVVEAELALGRIAAEDLPKLAWDALESGLDGPATRRLAALDEPDDILLHTRHFDELRRQTDYCVELKDCGVIHDEVERLRLYGRYDGELRKWMRRELERLIEM
jgi:hypothetical protein